MFVAGQPRAPNLQHTRAFLSHTPLRAAIQPLEVSCCKCLCHTRFTQIYQILPAICMFTSLSPSLPLSLSLSLSPSLPLSLSLSLSPSLSLSLFLSLSLSLSLSLCSSISLSPSLSIPIYLSITLIPSNSTKARSIRAHVHTPVHPNRKKARSIRAHAHTHTHPYIQIHASSHKHVTSV